MTYRITEEELYTGLPGYKPKRKRPLSLDEMVSEDIPEPIEYNPAEASGLGLPLEPGWKLKVNPSPAGTEPNFTFYDPDDGEWISKATSKPFNLDEVKSLTSLQPRQTVLTGRDIQFPTSDTTSYTEAIVGYEAGVFPVQAGDPNAVKGTSTGGLDYEEQIGYEESIVPEIEREK